MTELDVVKKMQKKYGDNAVVRMDSVKSEKIEAIPTGSLLLDYAIGVGGIPRGRITEIYGWDGSAKTTVCLQTAANAQRMGMNVAYIDVENALDIFYARALGVDIEGVNPMYISQPDSAEEALDIVENYIRSGDFGLVIVDSIAALVPRAENEGEMGSQFMGLQARLMSQAMRKLQGHVRETNTTLIFTNQLRMKIGPSAAYGNPETRPGGNAVRFAASVRIKLSRTNIKKGDEIIGSTIKVLVEKNKVAVPFRVCEMEIIFNEGINKMAELVDLGVQFGFITKRGAFYSIDDTKLGQGRDAAKNFLKENKEVAEKLESQIRGHMAKTQTGLVLDSSDDEIEVDEETGEIL